MYNPYENNHTNESNSTSNTNNGVNQTPQQETDKAQENTTYTAPAYGGTNQSSGSQTPYPTQTGWQYGNQFQTPNTYTWTGASQQSNVPYYTPNQQPKQKKPKDGKKAKKLALRIIAAALCCAVVSFGSVGIFVKSKQS